jgi:hypothetical protein
VSCVTNFVCFSCVCDKFIIDRAALDKKNEMLLLNQEEVLIIIVIMMLQGAGPLPLANYDFSMAKWQIRGLLRGGWLDLF